MNMLACQTEDILRSRSGSGKLDPFFHILQITFYLEIIIGKEKPFVAALNRLSAFSLDCIVILLNI